MIKEMNNVLKPSCRIYAQEYRFNVLQHSTIKPNLPHHLVWREGVLNSKSIEKVHE